MNTQIIPIGTSMSGYATGDAGEFKCGNCIHFDSGPPSHCEHPVVIADFDVPHDVKGRALVSPTDCCNYIRRPGDPDPLAPKSS